jgi:SAM-dependent methyltransferase
MTKDAAPDFVTTFPYILAPFVSTPPDVVERMLVLANTGGDDFVFDMGCGDGRILITAAQKYGARGFGVDMESYRVAESLSNAKSANVDHLVSIQLQDAATVDLAPATVITLYLVQGSNDRMGQKIRAEARPGTRVVSHSFYIKGWEPTKYEEFIDSEGRLVSCTCGWLNRLKSWGPQASSPASRQPKYCDR